MKENKLTSFGPIFKESVKDFGSRFGTIAAFSAIIFAIGVVFPLLFTAALFVGLKSAIIGTALGGILAVLFITAAWLANGAFMYSMKDGAKFKESFKFIWKSFKPYAWIALLAFFVVLPGIVALIIPGLIMSVFLMFSLFVFMDDGTKGMAALAKSKEYVKGRFWAIIGRGTLFILVVIGANLIISILGQPILQPLFSAFVVSPISLCFYWRLFKDIKSKHPADAHAGKNKFIKALAVIGAVILSAVIVIGSVLAFTNLPAIQQIIKESILEMTSPTLDLPDETEETGLSEEDAQELQRLFEEIQNSQ